MKREILEEAIAEAKVIKASAIANAKVALEEAFTPHLKSMLATKLEEMENEEEVTESKGFEEELNMDEVLKITEEVLENDEVTEEEETKETEDEEGEEGEEGKVEDEDEDINIEDMSEEDLKFFIEEVIDDMVGTGELEAGENFNQEDTESAEGEEEMNLGIEDETETEIAETKVEEEVKIEGTEVSESAFNEMKDELDESNATIKQLSEELKDINILNSKLLYSNKIFKAKTLNETQKTKVLAAFDKAKNVREVKLIFETLNSGLKSTLKPTNKRRVNEHKGSSSRALLTSKKKAPIMESNEMVNYFHKIAGIGQKK